MPPAAESTGRDPAPPSLCHRARRPCASRSQCLAFTAVAHIAIAADSLPGIERAAASALPTLPGTEGEGSSHPPS